MKIGPGFRVAEMGVGPANRRSGMAVIPRAGMTIHAVMMGCRQDIPRHAGPVGQAQPFSGIGVLGSSVMPKRGLAAGPAAHRDGHHMSDHKTQQNQPTTYHSRQPIRPSQLPIQQRCRYQQGHQH